MVLTREELLELGFSSLLLLGCDVADTVAPAPYAPTAAAGVVPPGQFL